MFGLNAFRERVARLKQDVNELHSRVEKCERQRIGKCGRCGHDVVIPNKYANYGECTSCKATCDLPKLKMHERRGKKKRGDRPNARQYMTSADIASMQQHQPRTVISYYGPYGRSPFSWYVPAVDPNR